MSGEFSSDQMILNLEGRRLHEEIKTRYRILGLVG